MSDLTVNDAKKKRRDLEKRLQIDIQQFQLDTGLRVERVTLVQHETMAHAFGMKSPELAAVVIEVELPR